MVFIPREHKDDVVMITGGTPSQRAVVVLAYIDMEAKEVWAEQGEASLEDKESLMKVVPYISELIEMGEEAISAISKVLPNVPNQLAEICLVTALSQIGGDKARNVICGQMPHLSQKAKEVAEDFLKTQTD
ncbi:hypothetical protein A2V71_03430 [Candidatus Berkelbacteria bacterium RBG_13_40_8]|uniref:Uncharacterized protein n=1 Tax=Candidatus Berkelbacteria bacterium RBG_13_40_8 TaxID=1797467 RepID=A0A1F5DQW1_9BACT|nr:MAG: hypothetical protein A2V71_03430 [Candidatus Berkelbacteria bacterium RBG_13_40_8]